MLRWIDESVVRLLTGRRGAAALGAAGAIVLTLAACGSSSSSETSAYEEPVADADETAAAAIADINAAAAEATTADEIRGGETYQDYSDRRDALDGSAGSYAGYGCTEDCGGHQAGYEWAEAHDISDPDDCGGNSWSFIEGCKSYAEEQQATSDASADER